MKRTARYAVVMLLAALTGCAPQMRNLPVGAGKLRANASIGGPLVDAFGTTIPVPYSVAGVTYGASKRLNVHADLHLTAAAFKFFGITPGVTWYPDLPLGPWVTAAGADALCFSDVDETRVYPELSLTLTHTRAGAWRPYAGICNTFQLSRETRYVASPYLGVTRTFGRWTPHLELKWFAAGDDNTLTPVTYHGIGRHGALALQLGISFDAGGGR